MKSLINLMFGTLGDDTPPLVRDAMKRMQADWNAPAKPVMTQEKYEALPSFERCILTCNMPGCGKVVCTHGMLCVEHNAKL